MAENLLEPEEPQEESSPKQEEPIQLEPNEEDEPIQLVEADEEEAGGFDPSAVKSFGSASEVLEEEQKEFKRPLNVDGSGATRCRVFHSKIAVASLEYMENQINEWLDNNEIEIKDVGHVIGTMEGKRPEPNLLVMVWY